jgi:hypothetical protein
LGAAPSPRAVQLPEREGRARGGGVRDDAALLNPALGAFRLRYGYALGALVGLSSRP